MKKLLLLFFVAFCFANCSKKLTANQLKDYQSVEGIKIGMPINTALKTLDKKFFVEKSKTEVLDSDHETFDYNVYSNKTRKEVLFSFNPGYEKNNNDKVFRIVLKNSKYKTQENIHVGMLVKDLKSKAKLKSADFNFEDGLYILSGRFDGGFWIELDPKKEYKAFNFNNPPLNAIPGDLKVKGIVLF